MTASPTTAPAHPRRGRGIRIPRKAAPYLLLAPGLLWLAFFFALPVYFMGRQSLEEGTIFTGYEFVWKFSNYTNAIADFHEQFIRSFIYAGIATVLALLIGYPLAYAIATRGGRWRTALILLVILPSLTTYLVRTLAWETILDDSSPAVGVLKFLHVIPQDGRLLATTGAVIAGITYNFLPFMILPLYASLERFDPSMLEAAYDLYASRFKAFMRVTLPISMPGVVAGCLLTFIPAVGDFVNAQLLGTSRQYMIGNVIQSRYNVLADYPTAAALSFTLMFAVLVLVIIWVRIAGSEALTGAEAQ
jgi:spermidine/putrescine transport system permease protein